MPSILAADNTNSAKLHPLNRRLPLPLDIIHLLATHLRSAHDLSTLAALSSVSKSVNQLVIPIMYRTIVISSSDMLGRLLDGHEDISTRTLENTVNLEIYCSPEPREVSQLQDLRAKRYGRHPFTDVQEASICLNAFADHDPDSAMGAIRALVLDMLNDPESARVCLTDHPDERTLQPEMSALIASCAFIRTGVEQIHYHLSADLNLIPREWYWVPSLHLQLMCWDSQKSFVDLRGFADMLYRRHTDYKSVSLLKRVKFGLTVIANDHEKSKLEKFKQDLIRQIEMDPRCSLPSAKNNIIKADATTGAKSIVGADFKLESEAPCPICQ